MIRFADGKTDQIVETTLSQLEGHFVNVRRKIVDLKKLDGFDRAYLALFMMAMHARTDSMTAAMGKTMNRLHEMVSDLEGAIKQGTAPPPMTSFRAGEERGTPITSTDTEFLRNNVRPHNVIFSLELAPLLASMSLAFGRSKDRQFVTSDDPCSWYSPGDYRRPPFYRGGALGKEDIEVTMPITPEFIAIVTHDPKVTGYIDVPAKYVDLFNMRTIGMADSHFVSRTSETIPDWFLRPTLPPDAWENLKGNAE